MSLQAAVRCKQAAVRCKAPRERVGIASRRQPSTPSSGSRVRRRASTTVASSASVSAVLLGLAGPVRASAGDVRRRHLATVVVVRP